MAVQPETRLIGRIRDAIERRWPSAYIVKTSGGPYQQQGLPDLFACIDGRSVPKVSL